MGKKRDISNEDFFERLIKEAPFVPGDDGGELLDVNQIPWLNPKLVKEGQDFVQRNYFAVTLLQAAALIVGYAFKSITTVVLRSGNFSSKTADTLKRYVSTERHIFTWYESDIFDEISTGGGLAKGLKDIQVVRRIHSLVLKRILQNQTPLPDFEEVPGKEKRQELLNAIKEDFKSFSTAKSPLHLLTYNSPLFMSQFDMALTQYGIIGPILLFPNVVGIKDTRGMEGFMHLWAVIGRILGIQDRFNFGLHANKELFTNVFRQIGIPSIIETDQRVLVLQESLSNGLSQLFGYVPLRTILYHAISGTKPILPEYDGKNLYKIMSWPERAALVLLKFIVFLVSHFTIFRVGFNKLTKLLVAYNTGRVLRPNKSNRSLAKNKDLNDNETK